MGPNDYQQRALAKEANQERIRDHVYRQGVKATRFSNGIRGLTDEVGELADLEKRWLEYQGKEPTQVQVLEECGDVLWRVSQILASFGLTLDQAMEANLAKLEGVRYKVGICNPHDAAEENRNREAEAMVVQNTIDSRKLVETVVRRNRAEDDGVDYEETT